MRLAAECIKTMYPAKSSRKAAFLLVAAGRVPSFAFPEKCCSQNKLLPNSAGK